MENKELVTAGRQTDRIMPVVFRYRMLILFFVLLVVTGVFCGSVSADNPDVSYAQNLSDALNISVTGAAYANGDTVYLIKDVPLNFTINITAASPITLTTVDNDHTISRSVSTVPLFKVNSGTLILQGNGGKNLTIDGNKTAYTSSAGGYSLISVKGGGLNMSDGAVLQNSNAVIGSGVNMDDGTFTMTGGTISNNSADYGGGVLVQHGTFNMTGGTISNNSADYGGGMYVNYGTFNMMGGTISTNSADFGGGLYVNYGTFNMAGSAEVNADNDVYLYITTRIITVTGALDPSAGARNITPGFTGIGNKVVEYGSVDISNWSSNFALNTTWALVNSRALTNSSNILSLIENITVTFYLENGETTPYHTITNLSSGDTITAPPAPTKTGYTFNSWNIAGSSGTLWNFTTSTVSGYTKLYANWTANPTPTPTPTTAPTSSGGNGGNDGNDADAGYTSPDGTYTSKDGGLILHYPTGSSVIVTIFPDYLGGGVSAPLNVSYLSLYDVYSTAQPGTPVTLSFKVNASELDALGLLPKDISILHYYDGQWHRMTIESVELVDGEYWFTVMSTHTSPFMVAYNIDGLLFPLEGGATSTPSEAPTTGPTDVVPTTTSTPIPTKTPSSPVPFIGIIAGLGAVVLLMRRT